VSDLVASQGETIADEQSATQLPPIAMELSKCQSDTALYFCHL